jgi:hypothetical protein
MLIPAVDYFSRAIEVAERAGQLPGDLLSEVRIPFPIAPSSSPCLHIFVVHIITD